MKQSGLNNFRGNSGNLARERSLGDGQGYPTNTHQSAYSSIPSVNSVVTRQTMQPRIGGGTAAIGSSNPYAKYLSPSVGIGGGTNNIGKNVGGATGIGGGLDAQYQQMRRGQDTPEKAKYGGDGQGGAKGSCEKQGAGKGGQLSDESLICQTCEQPFNESIRAPKIMPQCGHCFCQQCLKAAFERHFAKKLMFEPDQLYLFKENDQSLRNMLDPVSYFISDKGTLQCPEDELELDPSITSVQNLRKNFSLVQKIMNQRQGSSSGVYATTKPNVNVIESYGLNSSQQELDQRQSYNYAQSSTSIPLKQSGPQDQKKFQQNYQATVFSKNLSPDIHKMPGSQSQVIVQEENSPFPMQRGGNETQSQFVSKIGFNKNSFQSDQNKPGSHGIGSFTDRLTTPRQVSTLQNNFFRSNSRGNQQNAPFQPVAPPKTTRMTEIPGGGFNIKLQQMTQARNFSKDKTHDTSNVNMQDLRGQRLPGSSPLQSRNSQSQLNYRNTQKQPHSRPMTIEKSSEDAKNPIFAPKKPQGPKLNFNYNSNKNDQEIAMPTFSGIGHGPLHGSIINHLRDSPLKQTVQKRILMNNNNNDGYDEMVIEEAEDDDEDNIRLRRDSVKSKQQLNNTGRSNNLRATGGKNRQRVEQMQQHNWHKKFKAYKEQQQNGRNEKMVDMKAALNQQLMGLKQSFVQEEDENEQSFQQFGVRNSNLQMQPVPTVQICVQHDKPKELICLSCRSMVCHTCALFGEHKGHDVRERIDTMKEIEVRTEVLMEMFEQMDQEVEKLQQNTNWQRLKNVMVDKKNHLKTLISNQFCEWQALLSKMELDAHNLVDQRFKKYDDMFDLESDELKAVEEDNRQLMIKMGDILNNYMNEIENDADYISYDILESDVTNPNSVEALYQQIEKFIAENIEVVKFEELEKLENEYDTIYTWFDKNFDDRVQNIVQVIDKEHPLKLRNQLPNEPEVQTINTSKTSNSFDQQNTSSQSQQKDEIKNKFKSFKNSFNKETRSTSKNKNAALPPSGIANIDSTYMPQAQPDLEKPQVSYNKTTDQPLNQLNPTSQDISQPLTQKSDSKKPSKGFIMVENAPQHQSNPEVNTSADPISVQQIPFENSATSIKMEDIDFYKLSMIASGGNENKQELNQENIKEVVQQQVQAALQQQMDVAKSTQSEFLKNLQFFMQAATSLNQQSNPLVSAAMTAGNATGIGGLLDAIKGSTGTGASASTENKKSQEMTVNEKKIKQIEKEEPNYCLRNTDQNQKQVESMWMSKSTKTHKNNDYNDDLDSDTQYDHVEQDLHDTIDSEIGRNRGLQHSGHKSMGSSEKPPKYYQQQQKSKIGGLGNPSNVSKDDDQYLAIPSDEQPGSFTEKSDLMSFENKQGPEPRTTASKAGLKKPTSARDYNTNSKKTPRQQQSDNQKKDSKHSEQFGTDSDRNDSITRQLEDIKKSKLKDKGASSQEAEKKQIPGAKGKAKFNIVESFKIQCEIGDVDLSGKGLTDNHCHQICQLLKQHAREGVDNLDLGNNKITDSGVVEICKALADTEINRFVISNNKLTDKCCELVTGVLMRNKHLSTLMMQDNQINSRVAKNKLINALPRINVVI